LVQKYVGVVYEHVKQNKAKKDKEIVEIFYTSQKKEYRKKLDAIVQKLIKKYDMHLLLDMVIFHKEFQKENGSRHPFP